MRNLLIKRLYLDDIMSGRKDLEVRVGYGSIRKITIGELILLRSGNKSFAIQIKDIRYYKSLNEMLTAEDCGRIAPRIRSKKEALEAFRSIYGREKEKLGIYVFEMVPADNEM